MSFVSLIKYRFKLTLLSDHIQIVQKTVIFMLSLFKAEDCCELCISWLVFTGVVA